MYVPSFCISRGFINNAEGFGQVVAGWLMGGGCLMVNGQKQKRKKNKYNKSTLFFMTQTTVNAAASVVRHLIAKIAYLII